MPESSEIEDGADATEEVEATDVELLAELRAIRSRLDRLEGRLATRACRDDPIHSLTLSHAWRSVRPL